MNLASSFLAYLTRETRQKRFSQIIYIDNSLVADVFLNRATLNRLTFNPKHSISEKDMSWAAQCCRLLLNQNGASILVRETQTSLTKALITKISEHWPSEWPKPNRSSEIAMLFKELLYENFRTNKGVNYYAGALAVSENYLNRCVKQATGKPPKQHINEQIINYSKILLQDTSRDISQIAFDLNFSDPSYFGRLFKQMTRQTPSAYRESISKGMSG